MLYLGIYTISQVIKFRVWTYFCEFYHFSREENLKSFIGEVMFNNVNI